MKRKLQTLIMMLAMMLFGAAPAVVFTGCEEKKAPSEQLREDMKDAAEEAAEAVEDAAKEAAEDAAEEAADKVEDAFD